MLHAIHDLYEVGDDGIAREHRVSEDGVQLKRRVSLEKLDVLTNDVVLSLPLESCLEDKLTGQNKYADHVEQNSKFEEIHQVMLSFATLSANDMASSVPRT